MTDQKYKLVPLKLTPEMGHTGDAILDDSGSMQAMWDGMLEVAPEPVCRWGNDGRRFYFGVYYGTSCGHTVHSTDGTFPYCKYCGAKVEVIEND